MQLSHLRTATVFFLFMCNIAKEFMKDTLCSDMSFSQVNEEVAKWFHCTLCGKPFDFWDVHEPLGMEYSMGFGSKYDGRHIKIRFCIKCFGALFEKIASASKESPFIDSPYDDEDDEDGILGVTTEEEMEELQNHLREREGENTDKKS